MEAVEAEAEEGEEGGNGLILSDSADERLTFLSIWMAG